MSGNSIPASWARVTMQDIAQVVGGGTPSTTNPEYWMGGDVPWITPADLSGYEHKTISHGARNITRLGLERSGATLLPPGTVLFSSRAPIGYVAIASNPVSTNQGFKSFVLRAGVIPDYLYYYLQFAKPLALSLASGTTFKEISGQKAGLIPVVVPPTNEQYRMVEAIESYLTRLDDAVASLQRVQAKLKAYRASVLKAAVEGRLVPTEASLARAEKRDYEPAEVLLARMLKERRRRWEEAELAKLKAAGKAPKDDNWKAKYEEPVAPDTSTLPELPEGWCWASADAFFWDASYGTSAKCTTDGDGNPVLRIPNIVAGRISLDDIKYAAKDAELRRDGALEPNDFLFIRTNGSRSLIGRGALVVHGYDPALHFASYLIRLRLVNVECTPEWFALAWHGPLVRNQLLKVAASSAGQHNVSLSAASSFVVPLPPSDEQRRILGENDALSTAATTVEEQAASDAHRCGRLRQAGLRWAFEGKLVDQDPSDEPADILLAHIRADRAAVSPTETRASGKAKGAA